MYNIGMRPDAIATFSSVLCGPADAPCLRRIGRWLLALQILYAIFWIYYEIDRPGVISATSPNRQWTAAFQIASSDGPLQLQITGRSGTWCDKRISLPTAAMPRMLFWDQDSRRFACLYEESGTGRCGIVCCTVAYSPREDCPIVLDWVYPPGSPLPAWVVEALQRRERSLNAEIEAIKERRS